MGWSMWRCCMAEQPAATRAIVAALADALRTITIVNGYRTDLGLAVRTERTETGLPTSPRCTVAIEAKVKVEGGQQRAKTGRQVAGVIEFEVPASFADAMACVLDADDDIDRLLTDLYTQMPDALPVQYEETVILDRPEGMPVVAAQIRWSTAYHREGRAP